MLPHHELPDRRARAAPIAESELLQSFIFRPGGFRTVLEVANSL